MACQYAESDLAHCGDNIVQKTLPLGRKDNIVVSETSKF